MSGYNLGGELQFRNATIINSQADTPENGQRARFARSFQNSGKGAANTIQLAQVFGHPDNANGVNATDVWSKSVDTFQSLDSFAQSVVADGLGNPDFDGEVRMDYRDGMTVPELSPNEDQTHAFGPNTFVPSENTFLPTQRREVQSETKEVSLESGGYGFKIDRNFRPTAAIQSETLGNYFTKHYNPSVDSIVSPENITSPVKGEFVDSSDLSY